MSDKVLKFFSQKKILDWLVWMQLIPLIFIIMTFIIAKWFLQITHPFEKSFAGGDLILFSALLLINIVTEYSRIRTSEESLLQDFELEIISTIALALSLVFLCLYASIKTIFLQYSFPISSIPIDMKIKIMTYTSIIITFFALVFASNGILRITKKIYDLKSA